jgi:hypothetical protein
VGWGRASILLVIAGCSSFGAASSSGVPPDSGVADVAAPDAGDDRSVPPPPVDASDAADAPDAPPIPPDCSGSTNIFHVDGEAGDYVYPGSLTITAANYMQTGTLNRLVLSIDASDAGTGFWTVILESPTGSNLAAMSYPSATRMADATHAGLDVSGQGRGCNTVTGSFNVSQIAVSSSTVTAIRAAFTQHCEGKAPALNGCLYWHQ